MKKLNSYTVFQAPDDNFFRLIPQTGVTHRHVDAEPQHNAIWDMAVSPEGRIFLSVCGESYNPLFARLYEYLPDKAEFKLHFKLEEKMFLEHESVRASKLHTAMSFLGDGKMISTIHTTSPSPLHPQWMPYEYENHIWEGYPGSILFTYDYNTGDFHNLGVFAPRDTTYGGSYEKQSGDYFSITWMTGTGYVYNTKTNTRKCLGQVSDTHTSRMFPHTDGYIYTSTYGGELCRYNPKLQDVEYLGVHADGLMRHAVIHNDIIYFTTGPCSVLGRGQMLYAYDIKKNTLSEIGRPVPAQKSENDPNAFMNAYGMAMDSKGRLWYGCMTYTKMLTYAGARLYMWDFLNGKEPIDCGFLGTPKRTLSITAEMHIVNDVLYVSDGNHLNYVDDACGIIAIDLNTFAPLAEIGERGPYSSDFVNYLPYPAECAKLFPRDDYEKEHATFDEYYENIMEAHRTFTVENSPRTNFENVKGFSFWHETGRADAKVRHIAIDDDANVTLYCGEKEYYKITAKQNADGKFDIVKSEKVDAIPEADNNISLEKLPNIPGRKYLAELSAAVCTENGTVIAGTKDGLLAKIKDGKTYSLGSVVSCGGVRSLALAKDGKVYGAASYERGIGRIFSYDEENGVSLLGMLPDIKCDNYGFLAIYRPTFVAVSPNKKLLAIGGMDELGGIAVITL